MALDTLDFNKKILHASWHPRENTIAVRLRLKHIALRRRSCKAMSADCSNEQLVLVQCGMIAFRAARHLSSIYHTPSASSLNVLHASQDDNTCVSSYILPFAVRVMINSSRGDRYCVQPGDD